MKKLSIKKGLVHKLIAAAAAVSLAAVPLSAFAAEAAPSPSASAQPTVSGCLDKDLTDSGQVINIPAGSSVVIDGQRHKLCGRIVIETEAGKTTRVELRNINFEGLGGSSEAKISSTGNGETRLTVKDCKFDKIGRGIAVYNANSLVVRGCTFKSGTSYIPDYTVDARPVGNADFEITDNDFSRLYVLRSDIRISDEAAPQQPSGSPAPASSNVSPTWGPVITAAPAVSASPNISGTIKVSGNTFYASANSTGVVSCSLPHIETVGELSLNISNNKTDTVVLRHTSTCHLTERIQPNTTKAYAAEASVSASPAPSASPSAEASILPSEEPSTAPSADPSVIPSAEASTVPSAEASAVPSAEPSIAPSGSPIYIPLASPDVQDVGAPGEYAITLTENAHGRLYTDKAFAAPGEQVRLWFDKDFGYTKGEIFAAVQGGQSVILAGDINEYIFTMPIGNVTVSIEFTPESGDELIADAEAVYADSAAYLLEVLGAADANYTDAQTAAAKNAEESLKSAEAALNTLKTAQSTAAEADAIEKFGELSRAVQYLKKQFEKYPLSVSITGAAAENVGVFVYVNDKLIESEIKAGEPLSLMAGDIVSVTPYLLAPAKITDVRVNGVSVGSGGKFIMPAGEAYVTVTAKYYGSTPNSGLSTNTTPTPRPTRTPLPTYTPRPTYDPAVTPKPNRPFTDVHVWDWYYDNVYAVYDMGLMNGTSATTFEPDSETTRAMMVTILYRMEGSPKTTAYTPFYDVPQNTWYTDAVDWAFKNKVVNGMGDGTFAPDLSITREEMATMFYRYLSAKGSGPAGAWAIQLRYSDTYMISDWAVEGVMYCTANGIMQGNGDGTFSPRNTATRAEIAAVVDRSIASSN